MPRYCGPNIILNCVGDVAYKLALLEHKKFHFISHASRLGKILGEDASVVETDICCQFY